MFFGLLNQKSIFPTVMSFMSFKDVLRKVCVWYSVMFKYLWSCNHSGEIPILPGIQQSPFVSRRRLYPSCCKCLALKEWPNSQGSFFADLQSTPKGLNGKRTRRICLGAFLSSISRKIKVYFSTALKIASIPDWCYFSAYKRQDFV